MPDARGEHERIRAILSRLPIGEGVIVGPGDDAAVLRPEPGADLVVTTDAFVEGRHFRLGLLPPEAIGRRLAAANLSDVAAMGARPRWALLALAASAGADEAALRAIELGCAAALAEEGASIVGGNLAASDGPASFTVTLIGELERGAALTRAGAKPGDVLAVTGRPGRAAATLAIALAEGSLEHVPPALSAGYAAPPSRVRAARAMVAAGGVHAAIDISDGLAGDLAHLAAASGAGARIELARWPADPALDEAAAWLAAREPGGAAAIARRLRLGPGDDYELLLAIAPGNFAAARAAAAAADAELTAIGEVLERSSGLVLRDERGEDTPLAPHGYDHFA